MIKNVKWIFVVFILGCLISFVGKDTPTEGLSIGDRAPSFVMDLPSAKVRLADLKGKYVLLSFWAGYDATSRLNNALLHHAIGKDMPDVVMVSVSFDELQSIFDATCKEDNLTDGRCLVQYAGPSSDLLKTYRLKKGFRNFLLDKRGIIIAKDVNSSELKAAVG